MHTRAQRKMLPFGQPAGSAAGSLCEPGLDIQITGKRCGMDINHTEITQKRREVRVSDGRESIEIVEENVEVISVAAAELRKVEEVAAAQAQAIAGTRGEDPVSEAFVESEDAGADEADTSGGEEAAAEATDPEAGETAAGGEEASSCGFIPSLTRNAAIRPIAADMTTAIIRPTKRSFFFIRFPSL